MNYYGVGMKTVKEKVGAETVTTVKTVIISYDEIVPATRIQQVNGIERIARRDRVKLEGIYPMANQVNDRGGIMSKGIKAQKTAAHAKQQRAFKRKAAIAR